MKRCVYKQLTNKPISIHTHILYSGVIYTRQSYHHTHINKMIDSLIDGGYGGINARALVAPTHREMKNKYYKSIWYRVHFPATSI